VNAPSEFEWGSAKAAESCAKYGIRFEAAAEGFKHPRRLDRPDGRRHYGEDRFNVTGAVEGVVLTVTYTMRGDVGRIISARRASRKERGSYGYRPPQA
jgi:uncharacterized DUF497 family protein